MESSWKMNTNGNIPSSASKVDHAPPPITIENKNFRLFQVLDPSGGFLRRWNRIFLAVCITALFVDPLFFYAPYVGAQGCIAINRELLITLIVFRTLADLCYLLNILLKFRTAFILPASRVIGRGELVTNSREIARRYLKLEFAIDFLAMLPLPQFQQIVNWIIMPKLGSLTAEHANNILVLTVLLQYIPRLFVIFPLNQQIIRNTGVVARTAWAGAAYNLILYMLASHVLGASWYLMSMERQNYCWTVQCSKEYREELPCQYTFLNCRSLDDGSRAPWLRVTSVYHKCTAKEENEFEFGIFADALNSQILSADFVEKFLYCLWWGLKNLSSYGQNLDTSLYIHETVFCILICIIGLVLFCYLIGNIQTYLQSATARLEEWRLKSKDTEEWMGHRQLPLDLQERVRRFVQYKWLATSGVNEDATLHSLPTNLRRDIKRHLCLPLICPVPFFSQMDSQLLDAICERLVSSFNTEDSYIVREGDPVDEMLFIIRGQLESSTTHGGRSGFFNSAILGPGDFCCDELLMWSLTPDQSQLLPSSTRTVRALSEVEAFALKASDLKFVANQFKLLHSRKLQHVFRYHSPHWKTWGACVIQSAWRRFKKRKLVQELERHESFYHIPDQDVPMEGEYKDTDVETSCMESLNNDQHHRATTMASKFAANIRREINKKRKMTCPKDSDIETPMKRDSGEPTEEDREDTCAECSLMDSTSNGQNLGATVWATKFAANLRRLNKKKDATDREDSSLELLRNTESGEPMEADCNDNGGEHLLMENTDSGQSLGAALWASKFTVNIRRGNKMMNDTNPADSNLEMQTNINSGEDSRAEISATKMDHWQSLGAAIRSSQFATNIGRVNTKIKISNPKDYSEPVEGDYMDTFTESSSTGVRDNDQHLPSTSLASMFAANLRKANNRIKVSDTEDSSLEMSMKADSGEAMEETYKDTSPEGSSMRNTTNRQNLRSTVLASTFAANMKRGIHTKKVTGCEDSSIEMLKVPKPDDSDFLRDRDNG